MIAIVVLSGMNNTVFTLYDAQSGHQVGHSAEFIGSPVDVEILTPSIQQDDHASDIVTLSSNGRVQRFHHTELGWEAFSPVYVILQCNL